MHAKIEWDKDAALWYFSTINSLFEVDEKMVRKITTLLLGTLLVSLSSMVIADENVGRMVFTTEVVDRAPINDVDILSAVDNKIYFFSELLGLNGQTVSHRWVFDGQVMAEVPFDVGSNRWRVWSSKTLVPAWNGRWIVEVVTAEGEVLTQKDFYYGTPE